MNKRETVVWTGKTELIPGEGLGVTGEEITLDAETARSFKKQGKAKNVQTSTKTREEG